MTHSSVDETLLRKGKQRVISVLEAKRKHTGTWTIIGKIVTVSEMYVIEVAADPPEKPDVEYKDAKSIQLEDIEKLDENERLDVILYNDDITNVVPGEVVEITGTVQLNDIVKSKKDSKTKIKKVVVNATSIKYVNRKELVITPKDIAAIKRFAYECKVDGCNWSLTKRLVAMFAPNVVGFDDVKLGVLRSIVGGYDQGQRGGGRVNTFLVGDPGTAKSTLGQEAARIKPNSRHVSAPHASSKTITAIAEKENETVSLKLGAIPLARNAICAIDEITAFQNDEQARLLDVLEEGLIDVDKHGRHWPVPAPTTIIATANPIGSRWSERDVISSNEIAMRKSLLDRFQQVYYFKDDMDSTQIDAFVEQMSIIRKRRPHNYNFLTKYLTYASSIEVKTVTREAEIMLNEFWKQAKLKDMMSMRMYRAIYSIAEAHAKLQLKDTIDADIAKESMELIRLMMVKGGPTVKLPDDPRDVTYNKFLEILQNNKAGVAIKALCEIACKENPQIASYLDRNWSIEGNIKLRTVVSMLRNHTKVKEIGSHPLVFQWMGGLADVADITDTTLNENDNRHTTRNGARTSENANSPTSATSVISARNQTEVTKPPIMHECLKCGEEGEAYYLKHTHRCEGTD